jgi:hypothetical protein
VDQQTDGKPKKTPASNATGSLVLQREEVVELPPVEREGDLPPVPATPEKVTVESQANLRLEYLASMMPSLPLQFGTPYGQTQGIGIHVLPIYIDELEALWGTDIYLKMLWDGQLKAADTTLRAAILDKPLQVFPCIEEEDGTEDEEADAPPDATGASEKPQEARKPTDKGNPTFANTNPAQAPTNAPPASDTAEEKPDPNNPGASLVNKSKQQKPLTPAQKKKKEEDKRRAELSKSVTDFIKANFEQLPGGMAKVCWEMLEAIPMGYKLAEMTYETREIIPGNGPQTCLAAINPKPQEAVSFVVDRFNHELGYLPRSYDVGMTAGIFMGDIGVDQGSGKVDIPNLVPPEKIWLFNWMPRNDNPTGTSHMRSAYTAWRLKIGLWPAYEAYLARFAQPSAALELKGQSIPPVLNAEGQLVKDPAAIQSALLQSIRAYQAGGGIVLPVGEMKLLESHNDGNPYLSAFELVNEEMVKSYMLANLSTQGGKYGTQALGSVHQDTEGLLVSLGKQWFAQSVLERVVKPLVLYNYGEAGLQVLPRISFGETEQQDFATYAQAVTGLLSTPIITPHLYNDILEDLHMKPLPPHVIKIMIEKWETGQAAEMSMALNPYGAPVEPEPSPEEEAATQSQW